LQNFLDHWTVLQGAPKSSGEPSLTIIFLTKLAWKRGKSW
jgi:hypothetical protein